jgi:leucyl aminopeptidase
MVCKYWSDTAESSIPLFLLQTQAALDELCQENPAWQHWVQVNGFKATAGQVLSLPNDQGELVAVFAVIGEQERAELYAQLVTKLPKGSYTVQRRGWLETESSYKQALLLLAQAAYAYTLEGDEPKEPAVTWVVPSDLDLSQEQTAIEAIDLIRDLINTPANYMMPPDLFLATKKLCAEYGAELTAIQDRDLLAAGYEATYRVGQTGGEPPCMLDFTWGDESHPQVTLVGKGVCYDTGGLSLKTARGMMTMKKDMGGGAHVLGLAKMVMANQLPVRLRVLIPAVENGIGKGAYRPGDVLRYNDGTTVEVTNTDAEGRLVVADALLAACAKQKPDLLIDFTTLTGAARVAVGMDIAAFFTTQADEIAPFMQQVCGLADPVWPMPLYSAYKAALKSHIADMANSSSTGYGGAITAALFLHHFVPDDVNWWHFDVSGWAEGVKPGGAAMGLRAMYAWLAGRYG